MPKGQKKKPESLVPPLGPVRKMPVQAFITNRRNAEAKAAAPPPGPKHIAIPNPPERHVPGMRLVTLDRLRRDECRWPVREALRVTGGHLFCGGDTDEGRPYCPHHHGFAYPAKREPTNAQPGTAGRGLALRGDARHGGAAQSATRQGHG